MTIQGMIALIWYIARDYSPTIYTQKQVTSIVTETLKDQGHNVATGAKGTIIVDGITYKLYRPKGWSSYDVRNIGF